MSTGRFLEDLIGRVAVTNGATAPQPLTAYGFTVPDASGSVDYDIVVDNKFEVMFVIVRKDGSGAGNTITVKNGTTAITDAIAAAVDKAVTLCGTVNVASNTVAAGGTLRVTAARSAGTMAAEVAVLGFVRP